MGIHHRTTGRARLKLTYHALLRYDPVEWAVRQLSHSDTTMVRKHDGRWISKDTKSMADIVSKMMGFSAD